MSHPQPPQRQPTSNETERYARAIHNTALVALVACPVLILIPPRKLDFYTFSLCGATAYSANYLIRERTGRSIWQHVQPARESGSLLRHSSVESASLHRPLQAISRETQDSEQQKVSVNQQVQNQRDAWKLQREKEIEEDIEEGKGFGDMIMDQIWEVWNWGKKRDDEDEDD